VKHLGLLGWWSGFVGGYLKCKGCEKDIFSMAFLQLLHHWNGRRAALRILLLPLKNRREKSEIQCADRECMAWVGVCRRAAI
jgi:hypothetical protein